MSKPRYADEAAFPRDAVRFAKPEDHENTLLPTQWGLTKRELFAAMAMQGYMATENTPIPEQTATVCVKYADALLAELAK